MKYSYDDYLALRDELMARPLNDVIAELNELRTSVRAVLADNKEAANHAADRWAVKWGLV